MSKFTTYTPRFIRFLERYKFEAWNLKVYGISITDEGIKKEDLEQAKDKLKEWFEKRSETNLATYQHATLIIHQGREGVFAILNWWIDENMMQHYVYLKEPDQTDFYPFSDKGIVTCVWEMAVLWHERNAWVKHVLMKNENPDFEAYVLDQLNTEI